MRTRLDNNINELKTLVDTGKDLDRQLYLIGHIRELALKLDIESEVASELDRFFESKLKGVFENQATNEVNVFKYTDDTSITLGINKCSEDFSSDVLTELLEENRKDYCEKFSMIQYNSNYTQIKLVYRGRKDIIFDIKAMQLSKGDFFKLMDDLEDFLN